MGKNKSKRIGSFQDFCKARKTKLIKENSAVEINVPFWEDAVQFALNDLRNRAGNETPLDWSYLVDNIKMKFALLNIYDKDLFTDDDFIIAYVKDILYHNFAADGFLGGDTGYAQNYSSEELAAKAFILSKLADTVLQKVRIEAGLDREPEPEDPKPVATVSLEIGYCDDDYLQYEHHGVAGFNDFTNIVKESVDKLTCKDDGKGLDHCLNKIESDAGSLKMDDILKVVEKDGYKDLNGYLTDIANEYLKTVEIDLNGRRLNNSGEEKVVLKTAKKLYAHWIVQELLDKIKKETV